MTHQRRQRHYRARIGSLSWVMCLALVFVTASLPISSITTHAQLGTPLLSVYVDPTMVVPSQSVSFTVFASGSGSRTQIDVLFPNDLTLSNEVGCVHSPLYCDGWSVTSEDSHTNRLTVTAPGNVPGPDGPRGYTRVTVTFTLRVPVGAIPGSQIQIISCVDGLFDVLEPLSTSNNRIATTIEVLGESGQRVPRPPVTVPTSEPTVETGPPRLLIELGFDEAVKSAPVMVVPGEEVIFEVFEDHPEVVGFFTFTMQLSEYLVPVGELSCSAIYPAGCTYPWATQNPDGTHSVSVNGYTSSSERISFSLPIQVSPNARIGESSEITGLYAVTDASTGEQFESREVFSVSYTDAKSRHASWEELGTLRLQFLLSSRLFATSTGSCVTLSENIRWGNQYFVCDNDSNQMPEELDPLRWTYASDASSAIGDIEVTVQTGTYSVSVWSLPAGFIQTPNDALVQVGVPPEGVELTIEVALQ